MFNFNALFIIKVGLLVNSLVIYRFANV